MYKLIILPIAKQDIKEAAYWYNSRQPGLGKRFTLKVKEKADFIKSEPLATATRYDDVKTAVLDTFPFMLHYTVDQAKKLIVILAVLHTSRNPDIWNSER
ncbi:type II toxin-antitoxin system RelE/ParE family toxin [Mucilaginibacter auburnensis]|uniref:ParE-like toxin of type II ParDE toxin-antitoxin system n=1 Tax=Mucilaginibacter auburnensis TaxID=1457233 RepID=A0A2H9VNG9_9SPHI|nr:type II toxin-antitoxin system RelE/ParE family toxin [Mucilaginibacter auburnensis]PJJ79878.1 ParE-like toxin of type II ParDE toxin-antitoxin system [Mucilaginibacter auburnensis]